jgi:hypothetical protein
LSGNYGGILNCRVSLAFKTKSTCRKRIAHACPQVFSGLRLVQSARPHRAPCRLHNTDSLQDGSNYITVRLENQKKKTQVSCRDLDEQSAQISIKGTSSRKRNSWFSLALPLRFASGTSVAGTWLWLTVVNYPQPVLHSHARVVSFVDDRSTC